MASARSERVVRFPTGKSWSKRYFETPTPLIRRPGRIMVQAISSQAARKSSIRSISAYRVRPATLCRKGSRMRPGRPRHQAQCWLATIPSTIAFVPTEYTWISPGVPSAQRRGPRRRHRSPEREITRPLPAPGRPSRSRSGRRHCSRDVVPAASAWRHSSSPVGPFAPNKVIHGVLYYGRHAVRRLFPFLHGTGL